MSATPTLMKSISWNLLGLGLPLIAAAVAMPELNEALGIERFGVLALVWAVAGYSSLFDLGLGRALTKLVAERIGSGDTGDLTSLVWTGLLVMLSLGIAGGFLVAATAWPLVYRLLNVSEGLREETWRAFLIVAGTVPFVIATAGLRGVLEAYQKFGITNALRIPIGIWTFLGPLATLPFAVRIDAAVLAIFVGRLLGALAHGGFVVALVPPFGSRSAFEARQVAPLLRFGGWITVSNVVSPIMVFMDRFLIGATLTMSAVAWYSTPFELVTKLLLVPGAVATVLFPAFSSALAAGDPESGAGLYRRATKLLGAVLLPATFVLAMFSREILDVWMGPEFAGQSHQAMQILSVGVLVNGVASIPFAFVQAGGRPDLTAKIHVVELPVYLLLLFGLTLALGVRGAALAWLVRVTLDLVLLLAVAGSMVPRGSRWGTRSALAALCGSSCFLLTLAAVSFAGKVALSIVAVLATSIVLWLLMLDGTDRQLVRRKVLGLAG